MWGITFLLSWCAAIVNELWERRFNWRAMGAELGVFTGVLAAVLLFGALRLTFAAPATRTVSAATVTSEGNATEEATATIDWITFDASNDAARSALRPNLGPTVDSMLARTQTALNGGAKIVAWQESSAWALDEDKPAVIDRAASLATAYSAWLQISVEDFTRTPGRKCLRNESILIGPDGRVLWTYDKSHPVPYDEAFATIAGPGRLPIADTGIGRFSTAICYDTYFPGLLRQAGDADVDVLFAPTNDVAQFAGSALDMAAYRAVENGLTMIRPTGKGLSAIIDREGRVLASQAYATDKTGIMIAALPLRSVRTIYSRVGDAFVYFCMAGLVSLVGLALLRRRRPAGGGLPRVG
jgi:apolipoprotein N-acyltransferase